MPALRHRARARRAVLPGVRQADGADRDRLRLDGGGDALAVIALYDGRVELRLLRGGAKPIYAIFSLAAGSP